MSKGFNKISLTYVAGILLIVAYALDAGYINKLVPYNNIIKGVLYIIALICLIPDICRKNKSDYTEYLLILTFISYLTIVSIVNSSGILRILSTCIPIMLFATFAQFANKEDSISIMHLWARVLFILVLIDLFTVIVFKNGLYITVHVKKTYTANWLLGYKTYRATFCLPMLLLFSIEYIGQKQRERLKYICVAIISILDMYLSQGTTALLGVSMFVLFAWMVCFDTHVLVKPIQFLITRKTLVYVIFIVVWVITIIIQDNAVIFGDITTILNKSETFSGRTYIWKSTIEAVKASNWLGIGLVGNEVMEAITGGQVNAHNQMLTVLLNGGVPLLVIYIVLLLYPTYKVGDTKTETLYLFYIYSNLLIGLVSAIPTYYAFLYLNLVAMNRVKYFDKESKT